MDLISNTKEITYEAIDDTDTFLRNKGIMLEYERVKYAK